MTTREEYQAQVSGLQAQADAYARHCVIAGSFASCCGEVLPTCVRIRALWQIRAPRTDLGGSGIRPLPVWTPMYISEEEFQCSTRA